MRKEFCIVVLAGRSNKIYESIVQSNKFDLIVVDSHKDFDCNKFLEQIKEYSKIIFVFALGSRTSMIILSYILKNIDKQYLVIANEPFKFEGKRKNANAQEALEYLESEKINKIIIASKYILKKYYGPNCKDTLLNVMQNINLEISKNIEKIVLNS